MIEFYYPIVLLLTLPSIGLFWMIKKYSFDESKFSKRVLSKIAPEGVKRFSNKKEIFLVLAIIFSLVALSRPYLKGKDIKVNSKSYEIVVGFDISNSMLSSDIYPNRLEFAKEKFFKMLGFLKTQKVAILGFSSRAFLIAPPTDDYESLKFLVKNMQTDYISLKGTDIGEFLKSANNFFENKDSNKAVVIFSDGGDKKDYSKEISYAKEHHIKVFVYAIGTNKGLVKINGKMLKDKNGNIVVVGLNSAVKDLALETGGAYLKYSMQNDDIKALVDAMQSAFRDDMMQNTKVIKNNLELFFVPLILAIVFFFLASFSFPQRRLS